jgi:hypothetical protein
LEANKEGHPCLLSSGAPPDSHYRWSGTDLLPFQAQTTVAAPGQLAHRTLSGAHRIVRCPLPTVGAGHASPADCVADHCAGDRWLTGQSGAPSDSPVNYSPYAAKLFPRVAFSPETCLAHRTLSGAPPDSPVCQTELDFGCTQPSPLQFFSSFLCF